MSSGSDHARPIEFDGGVRLDVDGAVAEALWRQRRRWDLELVLAPPLLAFAFGTHVPQASQPNRVYLDDDGRLGDFAARRLGETMTMAVRCARLVEREGAELRHAYAAIGRELAARRRRVVTADEHAAALATLAARPADGRVGRWRDDLRRRRLDDRHARWRALLREVDWNFGEHVAQRIGAHPPGGLLAQMRLALSLRPDEVTR